jgi:predicted nucleotidyltransferase
MTPRENLLTDIDSAVRRIVDRFHPVNIILFGSYARGTADADSDVDLLVVMKVKDSRRRQAVEIDLALSDRTFPPDLIVVTLEEFDKYRDTVGHILYPAVREGKILHDAARTRTYDLALLLRRLEVGVRSSAAPTSNPTEYRKSGEKSALLGQTTVSMSLFTWKRLK